MKIKTIIIDDELLARKRIKQLLADEYEFQIVGESRNIDEAISLCLELKPDLLFLDIQMPDGSGFEVLERLPQTSLPATILVTAYDQYTIKAFNFHAVDYLLKPFSQERFREAVKRVRRRFSQKNDEKLDDRIRKFLADIKQNNNFLNRLVVSHKERSVVVLTGDIEWITAYGNYLRVHTKGKTFLLRETISQIAERLNPENFLRIHRSTIVNIECISEFQPLFGGQYNVILKDGTEFILSRNYRKEVLSRFEV